MSMSEDQFNQQNKIYDQEIENLHSKLSTDRSNLENDFDDKRQAIEQRKKSIAEYIEIYQDHGIRTLGEVESLIDNKKSIIDDQPNNLFNKLETNYKEKLDYYRNLFNQADQELIDNNKEYQRLDEQLFENFSNDVRSTELKKDELKDNYYNQDGEEDDSGW